MKLPADITERLERLTETINASDADPTPQQHAEAAYLHGLLVDYLRLPWRRRAMYREAQLHAQLANIGLLAEARAALHALTYRLTHEDVGEAIRAGEHHPYSNSRPWRETVAGALNDILDGKRLGS